MLCPSVPNYLLLDNSSTLLLERTTDSHHKNIIIADAWEERKDDMDMDKSMEI